jgi:hypothetical protein
VLPNAYHPRKEATWQQLNNLVVAERIAITLLVAKWSSIE